MLREAVTAGTPLGREAKRSMDQGALVPDDVIIGAMAERLGKPDTGAGFILDGFPRTLAQAEALERLLKDRDQRLDDVVYFEVSEPELLRRLTGRRVCRQCGATFHLIAAPPRQPGTCDRCGGSLYQREDDREETVRNRLEIYARQTAPLLEYYRQRSLLRPVRGEGAIDEIRRAVRRVVEPTG
jgi:adenylate kinase